MKVGNQGVHNAEVKARVDEQGGWPQKGPDRRLSLTRQPSGCFQNAHTGGAHSDDATSLNARAIDCLSSVDGQLALLAVHSVLGWVLFLHGSEGVHADVQGDKGHLNAVLL